ncbi:NINE protein [Cellulomonas sp. Marseille-Q8402]
MSDQHHPGTPAGDEPPYRPYDVEPYAPQQYGAPQYGAPQYGQQPQAPWPGQGYPPGAAWSDKSRTTAGLLQLLLPFVGVCGVGRLYAGQIGIGLAQLLGFFLGCALMIVLIGFVVAPAIWVWAVVDGIVLLANGGRDAYGRLLR